MNSVVDTDLIDGRFPSTGPDSPARVLDELVQEGFVTPARRLLASRARRPDRRSAELWMSWINDRVPSWRLREPVRRFCTSRRREKLVSACVRQSYDRLVAALEDRDGAAARRQSFIEALRRAKKIVRVTGLRILASGRREGSRDVLFVIRRLPVGGIERALVNTVNALSAAGRSVDLLVLGGMDPALREDIDPQVRLVNVGAALAASYRTAVNYSQWHFPEVLTRGVRARRKVQWIHSDLLQIFDRYPRNLYAREYRRIDRFVCVSDWSRHGFEELYPALADRVTTIPSLYEEQAVLRRAAESPAVVLLRDLPVAISVARLVEPKGIDRAIRVHRRLMDDGVQFRWYVVGDGPMRAELEDSIHGSGLAGRFILLGLQHNPFSLMRQADVFVLPSYHEGYGLTALEARTLRLPMVLSDFGSAREIVTDGVDGLIAPNSERGIAAALARVLCDSSLRQRFRAALDDVHHDNAAIMASLERELFPPEPA